MLHTLLVVVHVLVCLILILVVLLQSGKGADLAGAFGGGGSQTAFGSRGAATLLQKVTTGAAIIFMITALSLAIYSSRRKGSLLEEAAPLQTQQPAAPAAPAPQPPQSQK